MHIVLLTMMALTGADANQVAAASDGGTYYVDSTESFAEGPGCDCQSASCGVSAAEKRAAKHAAKAAEWQRKHMMPQTCYQPRFGCYYGGERHMNRYPAFHGSYYRRAYNYRNLFEYPWHAEMHEPTSMFSYNVEEGETPAAVIDADDRLAPPAPPITVTRRTFVGD